MAKRFSVQTTSGVHGFPVGKVVKVVREEGESVVVTDGFKEATVTRESLTDELAVIEALKAGMKPSVQTRPPEMSGQERRRRLAEFAMEMKARREAAAAERSAVRRRERMREELADLEVRIKNAEREIASKKEAQVPAHYEVRSGALYWKPTSIYTLSVDATELDQLRLRRDELKALVE